MPPSKSSEDRCNDQAHIPAFRGGLFIQAWLPNHLLAAHQSVSTQKYPSPHLTCPLLPWCAWAGPWVSQTKDAGAFFSREKKVRAFPEAAQSGLKKWNVFPQPCTERSPQEWTVSKHHFSHWFLTLPAAFSQCVINASLSKGLRACTWCSLE